MNEGFLLCLQLVHIVAEPGLEVCEEEVRSLCLIEQDDIPCSLKLAPQVF